MLLRRPVFIFSSALHIYLQTRKGGIFLSDEAAQRAELLGRYIAENGATVREAAAKFGISKSTVHKDIQKEKA